MATHLKLIHGGKTDETQVVQGPITRMGLWDRFRPLSNKQIALLFLPKAILFATLMYFLFRN